MNGDVQLIATGIPPLDRLLGGGIPARQILLVGGQPGSGKTILAGQIAFAAAARGERVLLATAAAEPHSRVLESLQSFSFFQREQVGRQIVLLSVYPSIRKGVKETREMLLTSVREHRARLLVVDGLRSLRDVWRDDTALREFLGEVGVGLASNDCTGIFTLETAPDRILDTPEAATLDAVMTVSVERAAMRRVRRVEVLKVRGRPHVTGEHVARLEKGGFRVVVRIDAMEPPERTPVRRTGSAPFGIPDLDAWLGGGLPGGGATLLAGDPGTGKTILAAAFARAGAHAEEPTLLASIEEDAEALASRAAAVGLDLERARKLQVWSPSPVGAEPDEIARELVERAQALSARRVVVDGMDLLEEAMEPLQRRLEFHEALLRQLRAGGRDLLFTSELSSASSSPLSRGVDNLLELRAERRGGEVHRELWAVKVRAGTAPRRPWRFNISAGSGVAPDAATR